MKEKKDIVILGIESSCDETAASVVRNGREVLSNVISSQIALHTLYGGVVPEIASRKHIEKINVVIEQALSEAQMTLDDLDAIGVTYGPGLVGALLVGVSEAKAIAYAKKLSLIGVHHIEGHISANYIENKDLEPPFACLVVSGGHTHLVIVKDYGKYATHLYTYTWADEETQRKREAEIINKKKNRIGIRLVWKIKCAVRSPKIIAYFDNKRGSKSERIYTFLAYDFLDYGLIYFVKRLAHKVIRKKCS